MGQTLYLSLALHNHQPVGNFDFVFEEAYQKAYQPLIEVLEKHPRVRLALHYTGPLRDWVLVHHPNFIPRVAALVARGQVEMMTGGYYEPIIASIPDKDKVGQIAKLTEKVRTDFGCHATGMWLAERVWEPHLPLTMAEAGVEYTIVDDSHFKIAGLDDRDLLGYYVTEEQGRTIKVFASSKRMRYLIPWKPVPEVMEYFQREAAGKTVGIAVMGDDGEKFGSWPGTYEWCYEKGWMEDFFTAIEQNSDWLEMITPGEYARLFPPLGRIYLPTASYSEMMEWALPADVSAEFVRVEREMEEQGRQDVLRFLRGGFWRNFMVKYPEINSMHKKMLYIHEKVWRMKDGPEKESAKDELWMGQCNCPYWHGVFGGIYYTHIRTANYHHLIEAEKMADRHLHGESWVTGIAGDFDADSLPEALLESNKLNLYFDPQEGGTLFELDLRDKNLNLANTLSRRKEAYHVDLLESVSRGSDERVNLDVSADGPKTIHDSIRAKEEGLEQLLHYDWYRRACLIDHFLHPGVTLEKFQTSSAGDAGDFASQPFAFTIAVSENRAQVTLHRDGHVWINGHFLPFGLTKTIDLNKDEARFVVSYEITNQSNSRIETVFGSESNFALISPNWQADYYAIDGDKPEDPQFGSMGETHDTRNIGMVSRLMDFRIDVVWGKPAKLWRFPVETVQNSEGGLERSYQCSAIMPMWSIALDPGQSWDVGIVFNFGPAESCL